MPTDISSNLLRRYAFNEGFGTTAHDTGSEGVPGVLTNSPTWGAGYISLNGVTNTVVAATSTTAITNQLTVAARVKVTAAGSFPMIVSNVSTNGLKGFEFRLDASTGIPAISLGLAASAPGAAGAHSIVNAAGDGWKNIAGVYNGVDARIYIDGVLDQTPVAITGNIDFTGVSDFRIGTRSGGTSFPLTSLVDEVRVYARALSLAEVGALSSAMSAGDSRNSRISVGISTGF